MPGGILMELIKVGRVSSVYPDRCTAKVVFEDRDNLISGELQVIQQGSQDNKSYWMPTIGEQVVCLFLPNGKGDGYILGTTYNDEDKPVVQSVNKRTIRFQDGAVMEYDTEQHRLTLDFSNVANAEILIKNCKITKLGVTE
jgi:phage baseplate assembly protein V